MAVDPYALCPCGSGKKLKFCCADLAAEIEKIHTMIEGDQPRAALRHVDQILAKKPGRESLLDLKVMLELALDELDAAEATLKTFREQAPDNPSVYAQQAVLVSAREGGQAATGLLQHAIARIERDMPRRVLDAIGTVGQALLVEGNIVAARAHLWLYQGIAGDDDTRALQLLVRLNQLPGLPLPLRDHLYMLPAPEGHPGEDDHNRAQWYAGSGHWMHAAQTLDSLCGLYPDEPTFAYNRGLVYGWLGDTERFIEGMHAYARSPGVPEEDAIDAEAIAQLLDPGLKDPPIDVMRVVYPIVNEESLVERLAADRRVAPYDIDPNELSDPDSPPPRSVHLLLDKPMPETGDGIERDAVPGIVGFLSHFGRQTDRSERLEVVIDRDDRFDERKTLVAEITGDAIGGVEAEDAVGESDGAEQTLSWRWHFPADTPPARRRELLTEQRREAILQQWPSTPRTALGGKSPREAAADPALRIPLAAAVSLLEQGSSNHKYAEAFAELRRDLGLPELGPIDAETTEVDQIPLSRAPRLGVEKLSDDELVALYRRAMLAGATATVIHTCREAVRRPDNPRLPWNEAYRRLIGYEDDTPAALGLVEQAREAAEAAGESSGEWDLLEFELHVLEGNSDDANRLLRHLQEEHVDEPGVAEQLYQMLQALGIGRDSVPADAAAAPQPVGEPAGGKIWTPDSDASGSGQKLWTPS